MGYELDRDVVRWGLHDLEVCTLTNAGSSSSVTRYETDAGTQGYVREGYNQPLTGYADNDAVIAQFYQDELSRVAQAEASGLNNPNRNSVVAQDWPHSYQGGIFKFKNFSIQSLLIHHLEPGFSLVFIIMSFGYCLQGRKIKGKPLILFEKVIFFIIITVTWKIRMFQG